MASRENEKGLKHWFLNILILFSRDDKTRTCDLTPPRRVRYQLRYIPLLLKSECKGINFSWNFQTFWQVFHKIFLFKGKILEGKWGLQRRKLLIITVLRRWCAGGAVLRPTAEAPPPRRLRGFPLPSCSGKRPKVEQWRGVNGLANNELITVSQTIVGRWPPCHVLQHPSISKRRLSQGERGAETPVLLFRYLDSSLHLA